MFNYHIYNPVKEKIQVVHSINVDKNNLFNHSQINFKEFADEKWQKWNDNEFGNALSDINDPLSNKTKEKNSLKFPCSIMSLSTFSLMLLQTSSGSNKSNEENTVSVRALDFKHVNVQSEDIGSTQLPSGFIEEEVGNPLANSLALSSIILTCWSSCTWSLIKYNVSDYFSNIQYDLLKKVSKVNVITAKSSIPKSH